MTISAERTLNGPEVVRRTSEFEILMLPGDPGVTFTKGDRVYMSNGVAVLETDSVADSIGHAMKSIVCPAAASAYFPTPPAMPSDLDGDDAKTLIPVMMDVPAGVKVFQATMYGYQDETVVTYSAANRTIGCTTGFGADDRPNGALVYVYEGPGKGEINVVEDYDHTGGTVELALIFHRPFRATLTTSSKFICLSATGAANGVGILGRMDAYDEDQVDVSDGYDDGNFVLYADWLTVKEHLKNLAAPYINTNYSWYTAHNA
jgi:hypothetical protein